MKLSDLTESDRKKLILKVDLSTTCYKVTDAFIRKAEQDIDIGFSYLDTCVNSVIPIILNKAKEFYASIKS